MVAAAAISRVRKYLQWGHLKRGRQPPDVDILSIIWKHYKELGKKIRISWIKAHQDDQVTGDKLSSSAKLNIMADNLATQHRRKGRHQSPGAGGSSTRPTYFHQYQWAPPN
ncbi:hypothetical protein MHU86_19939 [Fragilaria crotonensis]|nr:hypothetical protein MHU86_19939 [Fragilaria crotonensis]